MNVKRQIYFNELRLMSQVLLKGQTPYRTGNLRSTIHTTRLGGEEFSLIIGGERAPYVLFVNERWRSPRWKGRENPREGFIDRSADLIADMIGSTPGIKRVI